MVTSPVERTTEALAAHQRVDGWDEANRYHFYCEACIEPHPKMFKTLGAFNAHVVALVLAALELTEERRELADGAGGISTNMKTGETTVYSKPCTKLRRWVSPWVGLQP